MKTPPTTASGDKRPRPGRVTPRRHVESVELAEVTAYDGGEFPVLLRLPDIFLEDPMPQDYPESGEPLAVEGSVAARPPGPTTTRHRQRRTGESGNHGGFTEKWRIPVHASQQFWTMLAPKVAVGGMLLAVAALCYVLVQGSGAANGPHPEEPSQWASDPPLHNTAAPTTQAAGEPRPTLAPPGAEPWSTRANSVASKPTPAAPPAAATSPGVPEWNVPSSGQSPTLAAPSLQNPLPASSMADSWSSSGNVNPAGTPSARPGAPAHHPSSPIQQWPDDLDQGTAPAAADDELPFNRAARSSPYEDRPAAQTALRESLPANPSGTRLNGTVLLPNPGMDYRK